MKRNDSDGHDDKLVAGWPGGPREVGRKARIGGGGGNIGSTGIDKRRVLASMEQLWRVYEVVMKRDLQLKGSVGMFNKVLTVYTRACIYCRCSSKEIEIMTPVFFSISQVDFFFLVVSSIHTLGTTLSGNTITYLRLLR